MYFLKMKKIGLGKPATHWTHENMQFCCYAQGNFSTSEIQAAKQHFIEQNWCAENGSSDYYDGESLLEKGIVVVKIWGLHQVGNQYYWTGETKTVTFNLFTIVKDL